LANFVCSPTRLPIATIALTRHMRSHFPRPATMAFAALAVATASTLAAQAETSSPLAGYFANWGERVEAAKASQPQWITPLATTTPRLEQEFRYDQNRQSLKNGSTVDIYDSG